MSNRMWEYYVSEATIGDAGALEALQTRINRFAEDGWELVSIVPIGSTRALFWLRRAKFFGYVAQSRQGQCDD